jgi:hypothetical protein
LCFVKRGSFDEAVNSSALPQLAARIAHFESDQDLSYMAAICFGPRRRFRLEKRLLTPFSFPQPSDRLFQQGVSDG